MLDGDLFRRIFVALLLHRPKEDWRFVTAGVSEDRLTTGREQLWYEVGEGSNILTLVEDVRGENQVKGFHTRYLRLAPLENRDLRFSFEVREGIVGCEIEGGLVVVRSKYFGALGKRKYGGQPDAAPQLDNARIPKISFR